jgi:cytidylate kinase
VVAIDGPAGSGKTSVARTVAVKLGYSLVDTGALYRCVALRAQREGVESSNDKELGKLAAGMNVRFATDLPGQRVFLDDEDVTELIREPGISQRASEVSVHSRVRQALLNTQRELGREGGVVLEGRDIGTVVFPDAEVKVFLSAPDEIRARRRFDELRDQGKTITYNETREQMQRRDNRDASRDQAPLKPAADALVIETGSLSIEEVAALIVDLHDRTAGKGQQ